MSRSPILLAALLTTSAAHAGFVQDDNRGVFRVDLDDNALGLEPDEGFQDGVAHDTQTGTMTLIGPSGRFTTIGVEPTSFSAWREVVIDATANARNDLRVALLDCDGGLPIDGFNVAIPVAGRIDISSIDAAAVPCLRVQVLLQDADGIVPIVNDVEVRWTPQAVVQVAMGGQQGVEAGKTAAYKVGVANSFVTAQNVVVVVPLPDETRGITGAVRTQPFAPRLLSASNGGLHTATATVVDGVDVPANSVFWRLGAMPAGRTQSLSFVLGYTNGLQNGVRYTMGASVGSVGAAVSSSGESITDLSSQPALALETTLGGTVFVNGQDFVFDEAGYTPVVTYTTRATNQGGAGRETIFNPAVEADLNDVVTLLTGACGVAAGDVAGLIDVPGGAFDVATGLVTIALLGDLGPGATDAASFTVDYTPCLDTGVAETAVEVAIDFIADNTSASSVETVFFGFDASPAGLVAMGERLRGVLSERGGVDDLAAQPLAYGETGSTTLLFANKGPLRFDDVVAAQQIPAGLALVAVDAPQSSGAVVFYSTSVDFPDANTPPPFDGTGGPVDLDRAGLNLWLPLASSPPASLNDVTWVAAWVPCVQSPLFPSPAGSLCANGPKSVRTEVQLRARRPGEAGFGGTDQCSAFDIDVGGTFEAFGVSTSIANDDASILASSFSLADSERVHIAPPVGNFERKVSVTGPVKTLTSTTATWTTSVTNTGSDTAEDATLTLAVPSPTIAGVATPLAVTAVGGGVVDWSALPGSVRVALGDVPVGVTRQVQLSLFVPEGLFDGQPLVIAPVIAGVDDDRCAPIVASPSFTTFVEAPPKLQIQHRVTEATVGSGDDVHYSLTIRSEGPGPSEKTWAIERAPRQTSIVEAYTSATDDVGNTFSCDGCTVFFAAQTATLPSDVTPAFTFGLLSQFQVGVETAPGVWTPPPGLTSAVWVAWRLDDQSLSPPHLPVGVERTVGLRVRDVGSAEGTIIVEAAGTLSADLPLAVSNSVSSAVLGDPGLNVDVVGSADVVSATDLFTWTTTYFNNASSADSEVILSQTLPVGTTFIGVTHAWNDYTLGNDPGLPAGPIDLGGAATQTTNLDGSVTVDVVVCSADAGVGPGIRGDDLALAEGGSLIWTVQANPGLTSGTVLTSTLVGCYENATNSFCLTDESSVEVANAELSITKLVDNAAPLPGDDIHYTLVLNNRGRVAAQKVVVTDCLPGGIAFKNGVVVATPGWRLGEVRAVESAICGGGLVTFNGLANDRFPPIGTVPGQSGDIVFSYTASVASDIGNGTTLTNGASVSTTTAEDGDAENDDVVDIRTPLPDPFVTLAGDAVVLPGGTGSWVIGYGNGTRAITTDVAVVLDVPDLDGDGTVDVLVTGANGYGGETLVCHRGPAGTRPALNAANPLTNGWAPLSSCLTPDAPAAYVGVVIPALGGLQHGTVQIGYSAKDPDVQPPRDLSAGLVLTSTCVIAGSEDDDDTNNSATFTSRTPGFDLVTSIVGDVEGSRPGTVPFATLTYTAVVENTGAENVCDVFFDVTTSTGLDLVQPASLGTLELRDADGGPALPRDALDVEVRTPVPLTLQPIAAGVRVRLGGANVCLQPGVSLTTTWTATTGDVDNGTTVSATCTAGEDAPGVEDITGNNATTSTVTVFRADVVLAKTGVSCGKDPSCAAPSTDTVNVGDTIDYTFSYGNEGGATADDVVIEDILPAGTCYRVGSLEKRLPRTAFALYSDNGVDFDYTPSADADGLDCAVVGLQAVFAAGLPAGLNLVEFFGGGLAAGAFTGGTTLIRDTALFDISGPIDVSAANGLVGEGTDVTDPAIAVDSAGGTHVAWVHRVETGDNVVYIGADGALQSCSAGVTGGSVVVGKPQIVVGNQVSCGINDTGKACPIRALNVDASTIALYEFDGTLADASPAGRPLVGLGNVTFRPSAYDQGVWVHGTRDDGAATAGFDWSANAASLTHPFTVEFVVNPGDIARRGKLFGATADGDDADGWYVESGGISSGGALVGAGTLAEGDLHTIALRSLDNSTMAVLIDGVLRGQLPIGFALPSATAFMFPGGTFEGVVESVKISSVSVLDSTLLASFRAARDAINDFSVALLNPKLAGFGVTGPQQAFVMWEAELPAGADGVAGVEEIFLCAPGLGTWNLASAGGLPTPTSIQGTPALLVDFLGRPQVLWGEESLVLGGGLSQTALSYAGAGLYPRRVELSRENVPGTFTMTGAAIGGFGPVVGASTRIRNVGRITVEFDSALGWAPRNGLQVTDLGSLLALELGITVPVRVAAGPFVGLVPSPGSATNLGVGLVYVADRSPDGEGTDVLAIAEDPKGVFTAAVAGAKQGILSDRGAGSVDLNRSDFTPDATGRLAPTWIESRSPGDDKLYIGGQQVLPTPLGPEAVTTTIDATLVGVEGIGFTGVATWGALVGGVERVQVGAFGALGTGVSTFGRSFFDDGTNVVATGAIAVAPRIGASPPSTADGGVGVAVAWAQAVADGERPRVAVCNDDVRKFVGGAPLPPFFSVQDADGIEDLTVAPAPVCANADLCKRNGFPSAMAVWIEERDGVRELRSLATSEASNTRNVSRAELERFILRHDAPPSPLRGFLALTTGAVQLVPQPIMAWAEPTRDVVKSESVVVIDGIPDAGTWTSPLVAPPRGSVVAWESVAVEIRRQRDSSAVCSRVLCLDNTECVSNDGVRTECVAIVDATLDVLDGRTGAAIDGFTGLRLDPSTIIRGERALKLDLGALDAGAHPSVRLRINLPLRTDVRAVGVTFRSDSLDETGFQVVYSGDGATNTAVVENTGTISTTTPEIDDDENTSTTDLDVLQGDTSVTVTSSAGAALPDDTIVTTVQACNAGPHTAASTTVVIEAPAETDYVSDTGGCDASDYPLVLCDIGDLAPFACAGIDVVSIVDIEAGTGIPITWNASTSSTTFDPDTGNNSGGTVVWLDVLTNVFATIAGPVQAVAGEALDVVVTYGNNGNADGNGVRVLTTPDLTKLDFVTATQTSGTTPLSCRLSAGIVLCDGAGTGITLPAGETGSLLVRFTVKGDVAPGALITTSTSIKTNSRQSNVWDDDAVVVTPVGDRGRGDIAGRCFFDDDADGVFDVASEGALVGPSIFIAGFDVGGTIVGPSPSAAPVAYGSLIAGLLPRLVAAGLAPANASVADVAGLSGYVPTSPSSCGAGGLWAFSGLAAGTYDVLQEQPRGFVSTGSNGGQHGVVVDDSPAASPGHGLGSVESGAVSRDVIQGIEVVAAQASTGNDFGDRGGSLAGTVWRDDDRDGIRDTGEPGIPGATVTIVVDRNRDGAIGAGDNAVAVVGTDGLGAWTTGRLSVDDGSGAANYVAVADAGTTLQPTAPLNEQRPAILRPTSLETVGLDFGYFTVDFGDDDGDGLPDADDADCDGDGIPDVVEGYGDDPTGDVNGNGVPDWTDPTIPGWTDDNTDFVNDVWDTDSDGVPDIKDLDSDGDGIPDAWEAWGPAVDLDGDGTIDDDTDADGDGLWAPTDANDADADNTDTTGLADTDGDGVNDWVDLDADGDGLPDITEAGGSDDDYDGVVDGDDGDGNGWGAPADAGEPGGALWPIPDTDADGDHDWQDADDDGDGIGDAVEAWDGDGDGAPDITPSGDDADGDGWDDAWDPNPCCGPTTPPFVDTDGDDVPNWLDEDDNGDGVPTDEQVGGDADGDGNADPADLNGNGIPDHLEAGDGDEDGDGLPDVLECDGATGYGNDPDNDGDGDGTPDWQDPDTTGFVDDNGDGCDDQLDPDGDGIPNHLDLDSDGDGIPDLWEAGGFDGGFDANHDGVVDGDLDADSDGLNDACDADPTSALDLETTLPVSDSDGDGLWDGIELEADGDGHLDVDEGWDLDGDGASDIPAAGTDANGNGWDAAWDPGEGAVFDTAWLPNTDGDPVRDWQDPDDDGDGLGGAAEGGGDTDADGAPDWLDTDDDGDGVPTSTELADGAGPAGNDTDGDGQVNWVDGDADNDGLADGVDGTTDFDTDGLPNYLDTDSDADGFPDSEEGLDDDDGDGAADYVDPSDLPNVIDLEITATTPPQFTVGVDGSYTLHVRNVGAKSTISSIIVVDVLPTGQLLQGFTGEGWDCAIEGGQKVVCEHQGPCLGGASLPDVTLNVSVGLAALPEVTHTADVLTDLDAHRENNTAPPVVIPVVAPGGDFDSDGDGIPDGLDDDRDNDGIPNDDDNCPTIANGGQGDVDEDGIGDACDVSLDAVFEVAGGGGVNCAQGGSSGASGFAVLAGFGLLLARRRRSRRRVGHGTAAAAAVATVALSSLSSLSSSPAQAQIQETGTIPAQQFQPAMDRDGIIDVEWGTTGQHLDWDVALWGGYALNPLVLYQRKSTGIENAGALVEHLVDTQVTGAVSLFDWVEIGGSLPVTLFQSRNADAISPALDTKNIASLGIGDLRIVPKFRILRADDKTLVDLAIITPFTLPTNTPGGSYLGDVTPTFSPQVAISRALPAGVRLAGNVGYRLRGETEQPDLNLTVGQELFYRAGVAYRLHEAFDIPVQLAASVRGSTYLLAPFSQINQSPLEALGGATLDVGDDWQVFGDLGTGVVAGFGVPQFRALAGVRVSPREYDRDGDGLIDRVDGCPDDPEDKDDFQDSDGCPDPDNDNDLILDVNDRCPLAPEDKDAFEDDDGCPDLDNDKDGLVDTNDTCPNDPEDFDTWVDEDGCPDPDNDADGILDVNDACPIVPGVEAFKGCPPPDRDGDGIIDSADACVDVPGLAIFQGCPDRDKDGIPDVKDKCPDEPETINGFQDDDGCPDKGKSKVVLTREKIEILEKVFFDFNKSTIQKRSFQLLDQVVAVLKANPQIEQLRVEGHTDSDGVDAYNFKLSDARAASVRAYLVGKGIDASRVTSAGYGETRPIAENKTAAGREKNRRVEFVIVDVGDAAGDATDVRGTKGVSEQPVRAPDSPVGGK